jgi:soluble lytic murein transglycosylase-like protein
MLVGLGSSVASQITSAATSAGVDPNLALAVAQQESGLNQNAVSPTGAIGVFQLMPATAAGLGVDPTDLTQNIQGGINYLAQMLKQFGGNVSLALAAYNAGPGAVNKYNGVPPYTETQNYVQSILSALGLSSTSSSSSNVASLPDATNTSDTLITDDDTDNTGTLLIISAAIVAATVLILDKR